MKIIGLALALILTFASTGSSAPLAENQLDDCCTNPIVRKEWRSLSRREKESYITAVKCLQRSPAITTSTTPGAVTRFDDFQGLHIVKMEFVHWVGQFLPWHRYFLSVYEKALRDECGYTGGQPYWDWTLDYQNWTGSPVFNPVTGFGGNGPFEFTNCTNVPTNVTTNIFCIPGGTGGGCITDGPFKDHVIHLGPMDNINRTNRCLTRDFHPAVVSTYFNPVAMNYTMSQSTFESFRTTLEGLHTAIGPPGQHGAGHAGVGGVMLDVYASPGDPLFYLHHGNLDKLWWDWQQQNPTVRLTEISGPTLEAPATSPNVTLDYTLDVGKLGPSVKIKDVMNTQAGALCFRYE